MAAPQIACQSWHWYLSWAHTEYIVYWFTYSSANRHCSLDSLWTHVKVIDSPTDWLATQAAGISLAWCLPGGSQILSQPPTSAPPPCWYEARQRCDGCGHLAPIPLHSLSESVPEKVEECQHFYDGTGESKTCLWVVENTNKVGKEHMIGFGVIFFSDYKSHIGLHVEGPTVIQCLSQDGEWSDESQKRWKTVFSAGGQGNTGVFVIRFNTSET